MDSMTVPEITWTLAKIPPISVSNFRPCQGSLTSFTSHREHTARCIHIEERVDGTWTSPWPSTGVAARKLCFCNRIQNHLYVSALFRWISAISCSGHPARTNVTGTATDYAPFRSHLIMILQQRHDIVTPLFYGDCRLIKYIQLRLGLCWQRDDIWTPHETLRRAISRSSFSERHATAIPALLDSASWLWNDTSFPPPYIAASHPCRGTERQQSVLASDRGGTIFRRIVLSPARVVHPSQCRRRIGTSLFFFSRRHNVLRTICRIGHTAHAYATSRPTHFSLSDFNRVFLYWLHALVYLLSFGGTLISRRKFRGTSWPHVDPVLDMVESHIRQKKIMATSNFGIPSLKHCFWRSHAVQKNLFAHPPRL